MEKFFVDKEINVYRADQADRLLKEKNDRIRRGSENKIT